MKFSLHKTGLVCLVVGLLLFASVRTASAIQISRNNPYRSFSITGLNYGAVQWERAHRKNQNQQQPPRPSAPRLWKRTR